MVIGKYVADEEQVKILPHPYGYWRFTTYLISKSTLLAMDS